jgi:hypothetical protein
MRDAARSEPESAEASEAMERTRGDAPDYPSARTPLTDEHVREYWERGFSVVRGLFTTEELAAWDQRFVDIVEKRSPAAPRTLVMRDVMIAKGAVAPRSELHAIAKIQDFENDPILDAYNTHPKLLDCVERLLGPNLQSIHCMLINKPPDVDGRCTRRA